VLQEADRVGAIMEVVGHSSSGCEQSSAPSRLDGRGPVDNLTSAVSSRARSAVSSSSPVIPGTLGVSDADTGKDTGDDPEATQQDSQLDGIENRTEEEKEREAAETPVRARGGSDMSDDQ